MGGWAKFFKLLASEDINGNKMNLGVAVLAGLGCGHVDNLARAVLDDNEAVLPQGRALHGIRSGSASIGRIKSMLMLKYSVSNGRLDMAKYDGLERMRPTARFVWWGACGVSRGELTWASLFSAIFSDVAI